jgi:drug/metabolite transporter (DMT)-like permease
MICYALANVVVEQRLAKLNSLTIIVCYSGIIFCTTFIAWCIVKINDPTLPFPKGTVLFAVLGVGVLFTLADYFFITAYTSGGKQFVVTSIYVLFPVCASFIKFLTTGEQPNIWLVCGYGCAIAAVLCISKGSVVTVHNQIPP